MLPLIVMTQLCSKLDIIQFSQYSSYRPQRSWGKVIFSQASVILSTGRGACGGVCVVAGGMHGCQGVRGGVRGGGGCAWWGHASLLAGRVWDMTRYGE